MRLEMHKSFHKARQKRYDESSLIEKISFDEAIKRDSEDYSYYFYYALVPNNELFKKLQEQHDNADLEEKLYLKKQMTENYKFDLELFSSNIKMLLDYEFIDNIKNYKRNMKANLLLF